MTGFPVIPIARLELALEQRPWRFALDRGAEIDVHFVEQKRANPALFNGRMLVLHRHAIIDGVFQGAFLETDYAAFLAWHRWGFPDDSVKDCFAQGALLAADGAFLLGVMGPESMNAGRLYFPSGVPDPSDVVGASVDFDASVWREVAEETGLTSADLIADPGWTVVLTGPMIPHIKVLRAREDAVTLRERILRFLASERQPELSDVRIVRGPADLDPMMLDFVPAFLRSFWTKGG